MSSCVMAKGKKEKWGRPRERKGEREERKKKRGEREKRERMKW